MERCMCGDSQCNVCGAEQGTLDMSAEWERAERELVAAKAAYAAACARHYSEWSEETHQECKRLLSVVDDAERRENAAMHAAARAGDFHAGVCIGQANRLAAEHSAAIYVRERMIADGLIYAGR